MGDVGDTFRALKAHKKALKDKYGVLCSGCQKRFPKAHPKILLPGQRCFCGHRDSRPRLDDDPQYYMEQGHRRPISDERSEERPASESSVASPATNGSDLERLVMHQYY